MSIKYCSEKKLCKSEYYDDLKKLLCKYNVIKQTYNAYVDFCGANSKLLLKMSIDALIVTNSPEINNMAIHTFIEVCDEYLNHLPKSTSSQVFCDYIDGVPVKEIMKKYSIHNNNYLYKIVSVHINEIENKLFNV